MALLFLPYIIKKEREQSLSYVVAIHCCPYCSRVAVTLVQYHNKITFCYRLIWQRVHALVIDVFAVGEQRIIDDSAIFANPETEHPRGNYMHFRFDLAITDKVKNIKP